MLKNMHARLQHYLNWELPDVQAGFRKGRGTRDQIANICWVVEKAREFQKNIYLCFTDYAKDFDGVDHNKLWKAVKEMGIPDHLTCLLKNMYVGQEQQLEPSMEKLILFKTEKRVQQSCVLSLCLFNLYAEHITRNARLDELQAGTKIGRRNINNPDMWMIPL